MPGDANHRRCERRESLGIRTTFRLVDTCAAEFEAFTPYYYSSYGDENEIKQSDAKKIMILGAGPTGSGRASNSITVAFTRPSPCAKPGLRR